MRTSPGTRASHKVLELGKASLGTFDTEVALTFCRRKPRSRERAHSRKEKEQVRITITSNRSRKLLSPVGRGPWVEPGTLEPVEARAGAGLG